MVLLHKTSNSNDQKSSSNPGYNHGKSFKDQKGFQLLELGLTMLEGKECDSNYMYFFADMGTLGDIRTCRASSGLLPDCVSSLQWRRQVLCYFHTYMAFCAAAGANDWAAVKTYIDKLRATINCLEVSLVGPLEILALYLTGVYHQGTGDLKTALQIFRDNKFDLTPFTGRPMSSANQVVYDLALLSALNTLWIVQDADRQDPKVNTASITKVQEVCENHPNKDIRTAFHLVAATIKTNPPAQNLQIKSHLKAALSGAQETANTHFLSVTLSVMCSKFFDSIVGDQGEKSALAASVQAHKSGNILWMSVADGMVARCYDVNGKKAKAQTVFAKALELAQKALLEP